MGMILRFLVSWRSLFFEMRGGKAGKIWSDLKKCMEWNRICNFVEGQFLTKRNSNAKWREEEEDLCREFYGRTQY